MLHAKALTFPHPDGGERTIAAPLPADIAAVLRRLGLATPAPAAA
jgi:tRNA pseudouridine32 synthase/23S rRNA pseudouridine746 synthase